MKVFEVLEEGRLKSKSYKKGRKAAKLSGRRRKSKLRRNSLGETASGTSAGNIASVSGSIGAMQSRNMYNADGTMKNGLEFDNLLGGKKKSKKKPKTA